jgi:KDO2-lipid IV(A) lauroyltransferase
MKKRDANTPGLTALFFIVWNVARLLPLDGARRFLATLLRLQAERLTNQRAIRRNLSKAFPELTAEETRQRGRNIAANFGRLAAELIHIEDFRSGRSRIRCVGGEVLEKVRAGPAIFVGPHCGNWEVAPLFLDEKGIDLTIIHSSLGNALIDRELLAVRQKTGATYVEKSAALKAVFGAMARGGSTAFLVDQRVASGVEVSFFGHRVTVTNLPARLAMRFGCPIVPMETHWDGRDVVVVFKQPIWPRSDSGVATEIELSQQMMSAMEASIRSYPDNWFCNTNRWPKKARKSSAKGDAS